jgi:hypothetical protein
MQVHGVTATTAVPPGALVSRCFETVRFHELGHGLAARLAREAMAQGGAIPGGGDRGNNGGARHRGVHGGEGHGLSNAAPGCF